MVTVKGLWSCRSIILNKKIFQVVRKIWTRDSSIKSYALMHLCASKVHRLICRWRIFSIETRRNRLLSISLTRPPVFRGIKFRGRNESLAEGRDLDLDSRETSLRGQRAASLQHQAADPCIFRGT